MTDIKVLDSTNDIIISGGDLVFTSDDSFAVTMVQRIRARLLTFLGEWFLDDPVNPQVGVPYFQSLLSDKIPTIELADTIFRTQLVQTEGVTGVEELAFEYDETTRVMQVFFRVTITGSETPIEDNFSLPAV